MSGVYAIDSVTAFDEMLTAPAAVVFLHVVWSTYAIRGRRIVQDFELATRQNALRVGLDVTCWEIDVSDQTGAVWDATARWLTPQTEQGHSLMWGGYGSLLWCAAGELRSVAISAERMTWPDLMERTREAFS